MRPEDKVAVVTGGAHGIGRALARRFGAEGARMVVVVDKDLEGADVVANEIGGVAMGADVAVEEDIARVTDETEREFGQIDLFCSNAGIFCEDPTTAASTSSEVWNEMWSVNVMAHIYAAKAALPAMLGRGKGYFLNTLSAAGVLSHPNSAPYATTKHAALGFAESLAIAHGDEGIKVSVIICLCSINEVGGQSLGCNLQNRLLQHSAVISSSTMDDCGVCLMAKRL